MPPSPPRTELPAGAELECLLERVECVQYEDFFGAVPPRIARDRGVEVHRDAAGLRLTTREFDHPMFNRTLCVGLEPEAPGPEEALRRAKAHYAGAGVRRWMLQVLPHVETEAFRELAGAEGVTPLRGWRKHLGPSRGDIAAGTDLQVVRIGTPAAGGEGRAPTMAGAWAGIVVENFGLPGWFSPWLEGLIDRPGWRLYLALWDGRPVATGALFVGRGPASRFGQLTFAATDAAHRGRGAQSALVARRVADARELGVPWIVSETDEPMPGQANPSSRNLERLGFPGVYVRANWGPPKPGSGSA